MAAAPCRRLGPGHRLSSQTARPAHAVARDALPFFGGLVSTVTGAVTAVAGGAIIRGGQPTGYLPVPPHPFTGRLRSCGFGGEWPASPADRSPAIPAGR